MQRPVLDAPLQLHGQGRSSGEIVGALLRARPAGLSITGANPRHEHEWRVFESVKLPDHHMHPHTEPSHAQSAAAPPAS